MRITKLSLTHYRGAESLHLELDPHLNVFIGVNGSGKSTVLDAVAIMLSWAVNRIKSVGASGRPIAEADITNGFSSASINIACTSDNQIITWKLAKSRKGHNQQENHSNFNQLSDFAKKTQTRILETNKNTSLPLFIYYPVNRAVLDIPLKINNKHSFDILSIYNESLTSGTDFRVFFEWFREREDLENEEKKYFKSLILSRRVISELENHIKIGIRIRDFAESSDIQEENVNQSDYHKAIASLYSVWKNTCSSILYDIDEFTNSGETFYSDFQEATKSSIIKSNNINTAINAIYSAINHSKENIELGNFIVENSEDLKDFQLTFVRIALQKMLPDFTDFSIRRRPLRMEVKKNKKIFIINQLSDGEKCLIALAGDLARRMVIANPTKKNPLEGNGIVLIDEIDLHLHPKWQRNIIPRLTEVFPNCQFIISTHSPHVINHVQPENIFLLDQTPEGIVASHPSKSYGNNADRILEDLMGLETTRPDAVFQELRNIFSLIGSNSLSEAVEKIADLKKKIGTDPEIVKAEVLLARKEIIGK
jgi:predicted ATP-binding protein involved in virulence